MSAKGIQSDGRFVICCFHNPLLLRVIHGRVVLDLNNLEGAMPNPHKKSVESLCLDAERPIREALEIINREPGDPCLIVNQSRKCLGIITDGDVRRFLLDGHSLDEPVSTLAGDFHFIGPDDSRELAAEELRRNQIKHLPIVDQDGIIVGLWIFENDSTRSHEIENPVLVLAGGKGSRLNPLTLSLPKPLIRVGDVTLLDRTLAKCAADGYRNFYLSVNYLKEQVIEHLKKTQESLLRISFIEEENPLGTAGPIGLLPSNSHGNLLVVNADVIHNIDLAKMMEAHEDSHASITVAVRLHQLSVPFGVVELRGTEIVGVTEKPTLDFPVNAGMYILSQEARDLVEPGSPLDMPDLIGMALAKGLKVQAFLAHEYWLDVGTHESLAVAESDIDKWHLGES